MRPQEPLGETDYQFSEVTRRAGVQPEVIDIPNAEILGVDAFGYVWPGVALGLYTDEDDYEERVEIGLVARNTLRTRLTVYVFGPNGASVVAKPGTRQSMEVFQSTNLIRGLGRWYMPDSIQGIVSMIDDELGKGKGFVTYFKDDEVYRIYIDLGLRRGPEFFSDTAENLMLEIVEALGADRRLTRLREKQKVERRRHLNEATMDCNKAWAEGFNRGYAAGTNSDLDEFLDEHGKIRIEDSDAIFDEIFESEENAQQYEDFGHVARAINERDDSEYLWECYEEGVSSGATKGFVDRFDILNHPDKSVRDHYASQIEGIGDAVEVTEHALGAPRVKKSRKDRMRRLNPTLKRGIFGFDPGDRGWRGYSVGRPGPGGFDVPFFEEDVVRQILDDIISADVDMYEGWVRLPAGPGRKPDYCLLVDPKHPEAAHVDRDTKGRPVECYPAQVMETEDGKKTLWALGGGGWAWYPADKALKRSSKSKDSRRSRMRQLNGAKVTDDRAKDAKRMIRALYRLLYISEEEWSADTFEEVSWIIEDYGYEKKTPDEPPPGQDKYVDAAKQIRDIFWPPEDPERFWESEDLESVARVVGDVYREKKSDRSTRAGKMRKLNTNATHREQDAKRMLVELQDVLGGDEDQWDGTTFQDVEDTIRKFGMDQASRSDPPPGSSPHIDAASRIRDIFCDPNRTWEGPDDLEELKAILQDALGRRSPRAGKMRGLNAARIKQRLTKL